METMIETAPQPAQIPSAASAEKYYRLFRTHAQQSRILEATQKAFLDGIELFAGRDCRERCERDGLSGLHRHYPAEYVGLLEAYVNEQVKRIAIEWTAAIGRDDVGFQQEFLVQDLLIVRVHYPHGHLGQTTIGPTRTPSFMHRVRYGLSSSVERMKEAYSSKSGLRIPGHLFEYARQRRKRAALPLPYRCHASHMDSWLGQPITSLSVWLAIAGLDAHNGLCIYPDTIGVPLPIDGSRFLGSGYTLPKPIRPDIRDGDLFVFSTDMLHSSQINVSDKTRIALTTRIDPGTPIFSEESLWFVERWYSGRSILSGKWRRMEVSAERRVPRLKPAAEKTGSSLDIPGIFQVDKEYRIAPSEAIRENESFAVQFENKRIMILRTKGALKAFSANCPHGKYRIDDGFHDSCAMICPGHGLEFDVQTGESALKRYRLAAFQVFERDSVVYLGRRS
jgi:nitrite reductase/ring-hydroxylating ferredoxin subunit